MKTKILIFISILFFTIQTFSQQIGDGFAPSSPDFTLPLNSGMYGYPNPVGSTPDTSHPWQHLLVIRHGNPDNNHQLQIASSFNTNDRLFFRKIAGPLVSQNPDWIELATRGVNNFTGNQQIKGNLSIDSGNPNSAINFENQNGFHRIAFNELRFWDWQTGELMTLNNGNVGIGTTIPDSKLTVNGTIHATEVKVTQTVPADYVFEKYYLGKSSLKPDYALLTLSEVEKFIEENHHLPHVPSAKEIKENGLLVGEMSNVLLQKIEELTLYSIDQKKTIEKQAAAIEKLEKENGMMKEENDLIKKNQIELEKRLLKIENK